MATVVLQYAGAALGTFLGGPIGGMLGRAAGAIAGNIIDQKLFGENNNHEGPRLSSMRMMSSDEGAPIPVIYGRMRISGQVIWASDLEEMANTSTQKASSKGGPQATQTDYSYFANFAVGLCEGEIDGIGKCWADGKEIDLETFSPRIYRGLETQNVDSLIAAKETAAPAYRGLAYIVFERLPLAQFGNRIPQLAFEVIRNGNGVAGAVKAMSIIPGSTEFGYDTKLVTRKISQGVTASENAHVSAERSDWSIAVDQLQATCENLDAVSLVVAWFGTDLRCGTCLVKPGVDRAAKITEPVTWVVSGTSRAAAHQVSQINDNAAYGGTPSDGSVIRALQDLHARGLKVMFYPFILMDIPAGNALPDPHGGSSQSPYPWRGRMTGTSDKTAAAAAQVSNFVGAAQASQFSISGDTVNYSGPAEWSFRRMILHYAKLCAAAGGVDAFLIGSELVGLSTLRGLSNTYPFVAALQTLAADVKAILPLAKISYGADWSEYFGHHPSDGSNDVTFHLDPLWSSASIDFIGIDNYLPLSDWRDGVSHLDYVAGTRSIYDQNYLQNRITSGENFDWYYATQNNRDAQVRTPITDGAYGKPWVFRPKDLKSWWSTAHYNRPAGVQSATPTSWVPQSKPIWFTEAGCPAIDKGTNQPNAFYDAKSGESAWPHYSGGQQDAQMQKAYVQAMQGFWNTSAQNPVSTLYATKMVEPSRIFFWAWDARPFPAFPARTEIWADGANYARGHWLNGRLGAVDLGDLITEIAARFGFNDVDVSRVEGLVDGFAIDRPLSARDALEGLLQSFSIDATESGGKLVFKSRRLTDQVGLTHDDLVEEEAEKPLFLQTRAQETELPASVRLGYVESGLDYRTAAVAQKKLGTGSAREISFTLPAALSQPVAQARVDVALEEAWVARETAQFSLAPHFTKLDVGDVLNLGQGQWRIRSIHDGIARKIEAVAYDASVYDPPPAADRLVAVPNPTIYGAADYIMVDLARASPTAAPWLAAQSTPWPQGLALYRKTGPSSFTFNRTLNQQATMATTLTVLPQGLSDRVDYQVALDVDMRSGALASVSRDGLLGGGNLAVIGDELIQFETAELISPNTYRLSGLLRGLYGSIAEPKLAGQNFILFNDAVVQPLVSSADAGLTTTWRLGPQNLDHGHPSFVEFEFTCGLKSLRPLAPVHLKTLTGASGVLLSWTRCTRVNGDSWELSEVPLGEDSELYKLDILNGTSVVRSVTVGTPNYLYALADLIADFASLPASFNLQLSQLSQSFGSGVILERTINV